MQHESTSKELPESDDLRAWKAIDSACEVLSELAAQVSATTPHARTSRASRLALAASVAGARLALDAVLGIGTEPAEGDPDRFMAPIAALYDFATAMSDAHKVLVSDEAFSDAAQDALKCARDAADAVHERLQCAGWKRNMFGRTPDALALCGHLSHMPGAGLELLGDLDFFGWEESVSEELPPDPTAELIAMAARDLAVKSGDVDEHEMFERALHALLARRKA